MIAPVLTDLLGVVAGQAQAACRLLGKRLAEWVAVFCDGRKDQHPLHKSDTRLAPG